MNFAILDIGVCQLDIFMQGFEVTFLVAVPATPPGSLAINSESDSFIVMRSCSPDVIPLSHLESYLYGLVTFFDHLSRPAKDAFFNPLTIFPWHSGQINRYRLLPGCAPLLFY